jgi:hypothetical protein
MPKDYIIFTFFLLYYLYNYKAFKLCDPSVTRQLRWRTEASVWAASAACSHHSTARVGHSRGFTAIRTSYVGTKTARYTHARGRIITAWRTSLTWNEPQQWGRYSINVDVGLYDESRGGGDGQEVTWRPRKFTSVEKMSGFFNLSNRCYRDKKKDMGGPLRPTGTARGPPSRGGLTCQCM